MCPRSHTHHTHLLLLLCCTMYNTYTIHNDGFSPHNTPQPQKVASHDQYRTHSETIKEDARKQYKTNPEPKRRADRKQYSAHPEPIKRAARKQYSTDSQFKKRAARKQYNNHLGRNKLRLPHVYAGLSTVIVYVLKNELSMH